MDAVEFVNKMVRMCAEYPPSVMDALLRYRTITKIAWRKFLLGRWLPKLRSGQR